MLTAPPRIYNWLDSQLSLARYSGGCSLNGHSYVIDMDSKDRPLVRSDVLAAEVKAKKQAEKDAREAEKEKSATAQSNLL